MPLINKDPKRMGNVVVTEFVDSVGTSPVTFTLQNADPPQETLQLFNISPYDLLVSVGTQSNITVPSYRSVSITEDYTSFSIQSTVGVGGFRARCFYEDVDEADEQVLSQRIDATNALLADRATDLSYRGLNIKLPFGTSLTPCKGDGTTEDSTAFQAAINYCIANNVPLLIPSVPTGFLISTPVTGIGRITIIGQGKGSNLINNVPVGQTCLTIDGSSLSYPYADGTLLKDFMITGNSTSNGNGLKLNWAAYSTIDNVWLWKNYNGLVMGMDNIACNFNKLYCKYNVNNGIDDTNWTNAGDANLDCRFLECTFEQNAKGIYWKSDRVYMSQSMAENNASIDMHFVGVAVLNQCYFEAGTAFTGKNLKMEGYKSSISDSVFYGNNNTYTALDYNTTVYAARVVFSNVKGTSGTIAYSGVAQATNSIFRDCDYGGCDTPLTPNADTAVVRMDSNNPTVSTLTIKNTIRIDNNPNGYLPINGSVKPTTDLAYDLGDSTHNWFRIYGNEVYLKSYAHLGTVASLPATSSFYRNSLITVRGSSGVDSTYLCIQNDAGNYVWVNLTVTSGTTVNRPSSVYVGMPYFDTTLGKPISCKSVSPVTWVDATGATV